MDEPTANLDSATAISLLDVMEHLSIGPFDRDTSRCPSLLSLIPRIEYANRVVSGQESATTRAHGAVQEDALTHGQ